MTRINAHSHFMGTPTMDPKIHTFLTYSHIMRTPTFGLSNLFSQKNLIPSTLHSCCHQDKLGLLRFTPYGHTHIYKWVKQCVCACHSPPPCLRALSKKTHQNWHAHQRGWHAHMQGRKNSLCVHPFWCSTSVKKSAHYMRVITVIGEQFYTLNKMLCKWHGHHPSICPK